MMKTKNYLLEAYFPYLQLPKEKSLQFGPLIFWDNSQCDLFVDHSLLVKFEKKAADYGVPQGGTFVSIKKEVSAERNETLVMDALYLLYFAQVFRDCYFDLAYLSFYPFQAVLSTATSPSDFDDTAIKNLRPQKQEIGPIPSQILHALSQALDILYLPQSQANFSQKIEIKRLIRSIRYFVNSLRNLGDNPWQNTSSHSFKPESTIWLVMAFQTLFEVNLKNPGSDLKQKMRPMFHLKFSKPIEIFWKWVDSFYTYFENTIHGNEIPVRFSENVNFEISHLYLGTKFFIYSICYKLFSQHLVNTADTDLYTPPHFQDIDPEEVLVFLWPEENLLRKISVILVEIITNHSQGKDIQELLEEVKLLIQIYLVHFNHFIKKDSGHHHSFPIYRLTPSGPISRYVTVLLSLFEESLNIEGKKVTLPSLFPHFFSHVLKERLKR